MIPPPDKTRIEAVSSRGVMAVPWGEERVLVRVLGYLKMVLPTTDFGISPHLALDGCHRSWVTAALWSLLEPGMHVVDVGAHAGYMSLLAASVVGPTGSVNSFEPQWALSECLKNNVCLNGFHDLVKVHSIVAWNAIEEVTYRHPKSAPGSVSAGSVVRGKNQDVEDWYVSTRASTTIHAAVAQRPDLVIIDAEGSEPQVIEGLMPHIKTTPTGPTILVEWHPSKHGNSRMTAASLELLGYSASRVLTDGSLSGLSSDAFLGLTDQTTLVLRRHPGGA